MRIILKGVSPVLLFIIFVACCRNKSINGIVVPELLLVVSEEMKVDYCDLLERSIHGDEVSIKQLALLDIKDGAAYDQGAIIVEVISRVGEDRFIKALSGINKEQKKRVRYSIEAGLEYCSISSIQNRPINEVFPRVSSFLDI